MGPILLTFTNTPHHSHVDNLGTYSPFWKGLNKEERSKYDQKLTLDGTSLHPIFFQIPKTTPISSTPKYRRSFTCTRYNLHSPDTASLLNASCLNRR